MEERTVTSMRCVEGSEPRFDWLWLPQVRIVRYVEGDRSRRWSKNSLKSIKKSLPYLDKLSVAFWRLVSTLLSNPWTMSFIFR